MADAIPPMTGWVARFLPSGHEDALTLRLWSGDQPLTLEGTTYAPGHGITLLHAANEIGAPSRRVTCSFAIVDAASRAMLMQDPGPQMVEVRFVESTDKGGSWRFAPGRYIGRLSRPSIAGGLFSVELETYRGDADRGRPLKWSHERQVKRGSGGDLAFEMAADLQSGLTVRWPP